MRGEWCGGDCVIDGGAGSVSEWRVRGHGGGRNEPDLEPSDGGRAMLLEIESRGKEEESSKEEVIATHWARARRPLLRITPTQTSKRAATNKIGQRYSRPCLGSATLVSFRTHRSSVPVRARSLFSPGPLIPGARSPALCRGCSTVCAMDFYPNCMPHAAVGARRVLDPYDQAPRDDRTHTAGKLGPSVRMPRVH